MHAAAHGILDSWRADVPFLILDLATKSNCKIILIKDSAIPATSTSGCALGRILVYCCMTWPIQREAQHVPFDAHDHKPAVRCLISPRGYGCIVNLATSVFTTALEFTSRPCPARRQIANVPLSVRSIGLRSISKKMTIDSR